MRITTWIAGCIALINVAAHGSTNLARNPGFEQDGGWVASGSGHTKNEWRSHDGGHFNAAILGVWATKGLEGAVEQFDLPVEEQQTYVLSVWLWADISWSPQAQGIGITFYDQDGNRLSGEHLPISFIPPTWKKFTLSAKAPERAETASIRIEATEVSWHGSLTIDDVFFGQLEE